MRQDFLEGGALPDYRVSCGQAADATTVANTASWDLVLQGKLTVHGVTRDVKVPTTVSIANGRVTARGESTWTCKNTTFASRGCFSSP